jgi:hypothetical protein
MLALLPWAAACAPLVGPPPPIADLEEPGRWMDTRGGFLDLGNRANADLLRDLQFCNQTAASQATVSDADPRFGTAFVTCMSISGWNYRNYAFR